MEKNSFTLFETLLSITILSIIVSGFLNSSYYDDKAISTSNLLNSLENKFSTNYYNDFETNFKKITIIKNNETTYELIVKEHSFTNENIKIFKYEK